MGLIDRFTNNPPRLPGPGGRAGKEPADPYGRSRTPVADRVKSVASRLVEAIPSRPPAILSPRVTYSGTWDEWLSTITNDLQGESPASLFRSQPHLRTVITFRARNMAQLGLHTYERLDGNDRRRDRDSVLAQVLMAPDGNMTMYDLIFATVGDIDLYDRAHWLVHVDESRPSGWRIRRLPPSWVTVEESTAFEVLKWRISYGKKSFVLDASNVLSFTGYSPTDPRHGSPAVESLKDTLQEQIEAAIYRAQVWRRGGRVSSVIERPADAPTWSDTARESFREDWYAKFTGRGSRAGGTPILEDGMTLRRIDFNAQEQQFVEAARLSLTTVAAAYHVNPTMIGQNEGANYSNVREFRKMLYGDTLGPICEQVQQRVNNFLIPMLGMDPRKFYVEFNIDEKLQGNFEEQSQALSTSTGAPYMTRNEARAIRNLPAVPGGDELVTPLNVLIGGKSSPQDGKAIEAIHVKLDELDNVDNLERLVEMAKAKAMESSSVKSIKAPAPEGYQENALRVLSRFFERQGGVIRSHVGAGAEWWNKERWDEELKNDVLGLYLAISVTAGHLTLDEIGLDPSDYDEARTHAFLAEAARLAAESMNETTRESLLEAIQKAEEEGESPVAAVGAFFDDAKLVRAQQAAFAVVAFAAGFGTVEAARQQVPNATKTWLVNSSSPRPLHAAMNGETVELDQPFSNGLNWPGAYGPTEQVAGCQCSVSINIPQAREEGN